MDPIMEISRRYDDLFIIEDCAQTLLASYKGRLCGTIGHVGCFSFQQSKHLTTGDGGNRPARALNEVIERPLRNNLIIDSPCEIH